MVPAPRPAKPRAVKFALAAAAPAPQPEPAGAAPSEAPAPQPAVAPFTIVPAMPAASPPSLKQTLLAIAPTGTGDPDAVTCRVPQVLPGVAPAGTASVQDQPRLAMLRANGEEIMPDGQTVIIRDAMQRRRILSAQNCNMIPRRQRPHQYHRAANLLLFLRRARIALRAVLWYLLLQ